MFKKVLSVALFLTLVLSMVPMAGANTVTGKAVDFAVVVPAGSEDFDYEQLTSVGFPFGILVPGTKDDEIIITMPKDEVVNKEFDVYIFLNGFVTENVGFVALNNEVLSFDSLNVLEDGTMYIKSTFTLVEEDENIYLYNDHGSSKGFKVTVFQDGEKTINYSFKVVYEDGTPDSSYDSILYSLYALSYDMYLNIEDADASSDDEEAVIGVTSASILNLRSGPSTSDSIIGKLAKGSEVIVVSADGAWYEVVTADGVTGYVFGSYVD